MVASSLFFSLVSVVSLTCAKGTDNLVVHERRTAPQDEVLHLRMGLRSNNITGLETILYDVSDPHSKNYETYVAPSLDTVSAVNKWLSDNGLKASPVSPAGDIVSFSVSGSQANKMLSTNFSVFTHQATGERANRTLSYSVPSVLTGHIGFINPTIDFPVSTNNEPSINLTAKAVSSSCAAAITPACLQELYGIPTPAGSQTTSQIGVSGFSQQFSQEADLQSLLTNFRPDLSPSTTFALQTLDGGTNPQSASQAGIEANLDTQYTVGVAGGVPVTFISVGSNSNDGIGGFLDIANFILGEENPPQVLSMSYSLDEHGVPPSIAFSLCNAYMQLGTRGVSVLVMSGTDGVSGRTKSQNCTTFVPTFPSGCPFVTSVGATTGISPETSASFSTGGFSNYFSRPSYQSTAVSAYLSTLGSTNDGLFNSTSRGFPDVSAASENFMIVSGGQEFTVAGSSATPVMASIVGLMNDALMAAGRPTLGFLNPMIYAYPQAFNDITTGSNPGCNTNGFPASAGWYPVTGVGTPNYGLLTQAAGL